MRNVYYISFLDYAALLDQLLDVLDKNANM